MPITFAVASHPAEAFPLRTDMNDTAESVFRCAAREQWMRCSEVLQTSIAADELPMLVPQGNGFVRAVLAAYRQHYHLTIRPDDVWMSILSQLSFYVNAHAEELRDYFVAHADKKTLTVSATGTRYTVDFGSMARQMTLQIHDNVVDKTLVDWILPNFTTTTVKDTTICAVLMMSTLKSYFDYRMMCMCGIPSVTLSGERTDWQSLLDRLDRLPELGAEPAAWARMLRPILNRFVGAFDGEPDVKFWGDVAHSHPVFYGADDVSGWITAFCVWDSAGKWRGGPLEDAVSPPASDSESEKPTRTRDARQEALEEEYISETDGERPKYVLDRISYPVLSISQIPEGFCEVDVKLDDNGEQFDCTMVAGHVAFAVSSSNLSKNKRTMDTISPAPQWFMYVKGKREDKVELLRSRRVINTVQRPTKKSGWDRPCGCVIA